MLISRSLLSLRHVTATEKTRYAMDGIFLRRDGSGHIEAAATDGKMLALVKLSPEMLPRIAPGSLVESISREAQPGRAFDVVLPTRDIENAKGEVTEPSLISLVTGACKRAKRTPAGAMPARPSKPERKKMPKRPKSPPMPSAVKLPKRPGKDDDTGLATWYKLRAEAKTAREARAESRKARNVSRENWRGVCTVIKRENREARAEFKKAIQTWKEACKVSRRASDVIALDCTGARDGAPISVAIPSGSDAERFTCLPVEGHFPPYADVMPKRDAWQFRIVVNAENLMLLAEGFDKIAQAQNGTNDTSTQPIIVLEMEGRNARLVVSAQGKRWEMPADFSLTSIVNPDIIDGSGKLSVGFSPAYLLRLARALHGTLGSDGCELEMGFKDAQSAITVDPCSRSGAKIGEGTATGVLMPINLA